MNIVHNKQATAQITLAASALPVERHAAEELQRFLREMSGVEVPIADYPATDRPNIYLGAAAPGTGLELTEEALGFDGFVVKTVGNDVILAGSQPYSCLYAVYHLLARYLGCGFFEDGDRFPGVRSSNSASSMNDASLAFCTASISMPVISPMLPAGGPLPSGSNGWIMG